MKPKIIYNISHYFKFLKDIKIITDEEYNQQNIINNLQPYIKEKLLTYGQENFYISFFVFMYSWKKQRTYKIMQYKDFVERERYFKYAIDSNCEMYKNKTYNKSSESWNWAIDEYDELIKRNKNEEEYRWW